MQLQNGIFSITSAEYPRVVAVWAASVRATHDFLSAADIEFYRPFVQNGLPHVEYLLGMRDRDELIVGFIGVVGSKIEMLFIDPAWRGQGIGRRLLTHAVEVLGATQVDVNEQNPQALGFYTRMGFEVIDRSALDGTGKPFPILHLHLRGAAAASGD